MNFEEMDREELVQALEVLDEELVEAEEERDEWREKAKKVKADFDNYRKDEDERKERWQRKAREELAEDLLEVLDNLERAIASADEDSSVVKGVKMVADQLYEALESRGLERIDAEGEEFDPELHKAVDTREHEEEKKVLEQKKPGYKHNGKVLRPAEVVVSKKNKEN